jgi:hypothetical protein
MMMILSFLLAQVISPIPSPPESPATPLDMYRQAIKTMHSITAPAYLEYGVSIHTSHKGRNVVQHFDEVTVVEKTADGTGRLYVSGDRKTFTGSLQFSPDLFLGHTSGTDSSQRLTIQSEAAPSQQLKTIGTVSVQNQVYDITNAGSEDLPQCSSSIHLALKPRFDPLRYNLREVWIDPTTSRICRAVAVWRDPVEFAVRIQTVFAVTLDLDANGFVAHWTTTGVAKVMGMPYAMTQDGTFSNIIAVTETALQTLGPKSQ